MPKILSYTPEWLARPQPGYQLFAPKQSEGLKGNAKKDNGGPRRTIASRGSEVFVAVGNEVRWADLAHLKDGLEPAYRSLKISIPLPITRLTISPAGDYLAVSTSHTVHVVLVPDSTLLDSGDDTPIRPKAFQVGPTVHVREESPVATTLWHPLGYHGRCLVTITKAGVVRLWEVNRADRSSFSEPTLSIDLPKLANATTDQDDLSASKFGVSKGFSPDSVELEVASACFGDFPEQEGVHGWAPMTLWIATVPGDVYALCPLLPNKWQLVESPGSFTFLQTLTSSININYTEISEEEGVSKEDVKTSEKQVAWLADLVYGDQFTEELPSGDSVKVFQRPSSTPAVPLLQGPFTITPEVDDFELTDLIVFSLKTLSESSEDEDAKEGLPTAVVCLLTDAGNVHVCLDLEGIVGRWLPSIEDELEVSETSHDLIIAESIDLVPGETSSFNQSITADVHTDFSFFVSHATGVFYISLEAWVRKLETELSEPQSEGSEFRLTRILDSANSFVELCLPRKPSKSIAEQEINAAVVIEDGNIGYLLLTTEDGEPQAAQFDAPEEGLPTEEEIAEYMAVTSPTKDVRQAWQPPRELYEPLDLLGQLNIPARHRGTLKEEIRLSPANLELLMDVHRILSVQTSKLQHAVSDLFNRATRLQDEFKSQAFRTAELAGRISNVSGDSEEDSDRAKTDARLEGVKRRQDEINARYESLRRKMASIGTPELSDKEAAWVEELSAMDRSVDSKNRTLTEDVDGNERPAWQRLEKLKSTQRDLSKQVQDVSKTANREGERTMSRSVGFNVPSSSRKAETEMIQEMIQRNGVLVEAATNRLRSLGVTIPLPVENGAN